MTWTATNERGEPIGAEKVPMENLGAGKFSAKIARLEKTLRYRAVTGPFTSPTYTAEAVDPPEIANVQLMLYPPAYTGLASVSVPEGNIEGLKGSMLRLDAVATKDVVKADIVMDDGKKIPLKIDGRKLQANLVLVSIAVLSNPSRRQPRLSQHADHLRAARQTGRLSHGRSTAANRRLGNQRR